MYSLGDVTGIPYMTKMKKGSKSQLSLKKSLLRNLKKGVTIVRKPKASAAVQLSGPTRSRLAPVVQVPIAMSGQSHPAHMVMSTFVDPDRGEGILLQGSIFISTISFAASTNAPFGLTGVYGKRLNPIILSGGLARIAAQYEQYRWQSIKIRYIPACSSTTTGNLRLGLFIDQYYSLSDGIMPALSYNVLSESRYNASICPWQPGGFDVPRVPGAEFSYFQVVDSGDTHALRTATQCVLIGVWDSTATTSSTAGMVEMDYSLRLYNRAPAPHGLGFSEAEAVLERALAEDSDPSEAFECIKRIENRMTARIAGHQKARAKNLKSGDFLRTGGMLDVNVAAVNGNLIASSALPVEVSGPNPLPVKVENGLLEAVPVYMLADQAESKEAPVVVPRPVSMSARGVKF